MLNMLVGGVVDKFQKENAQELYSIKTNLAAGAAGIDRATAEAAIAEGIVIASKGKISTTQAILLSKGVTALGELLLKKAGGLFKGKKK